MIEAVEAFVHAGYPTDAAAVLLVEVDGLPAGVDDAVARDRGDRPGPRRAARAASRPTRPSGRCCGRAASRRSARSPGSRPNYYLHDTVVPRTPAGRGAAARSTRSPTATTCVVMNVFHAGDGNLHPLLVFDAREPGVLERVHAAGRGDRAGLASPPAACCRASTASASRSATSCR